MGVGLVHDHIAAPTRGNNVWFLTMLNPENEAKYLSCGRLVKLAHAVLCITRTFSCIVWSRGAVDIAYKTNNLESM